MAKLLKLRRGTTTQHSSFTGAEGEVTVDTDKDVLVVHDGSTAGGHPVAAQDMDNVPAGAILGTQLENSGVTAGQYGSSSAIPIVTVDAQGLVTAASTTAIDSTQIANGTSNVSVANNGNISTTRSGTERFLVTNTGAAVTGDFTAGTVNTTGALGCNGELSVVSTAPTINFTDTNANSDYRLIADAGIFYVQDTTNSNATRLSISSNGQVTINQALVANGTFEAKSSASFTSSSIYPIAVNSSNNGKIVLQGSLDPYIRFRESTTDKAYIQWNQSGYLELYNEEHARSLRIKNGESGLIWNVGGTERTVWHSGNDGSGSSLDADTVDGIHASSFIRSDSDDSIAKDHQIRFNSAADITTTTAYQASLEVYSGNGAGTDAFMAFHVSGDHAVYFGLDGGTNDLAVGGWSHGANSYKIWHAGNDGASSGLDADLLDGQHGSYYSNYNNLSNKPTIPTNNNQLSNGAGYVTVSGYTAGASVSFSQIDVTGSHGIDNESWYRNDDSGDGIYNTGTSQHFYSDADDYWNVAGGGAANAIRFRDDHNATVRGYVYADNSNQIGFLDSSGSWAFRTQRHNNSATLYDSHFYTDTNGTYDLGSSSARWRNVYTSDLDLSNEAKGVNDIDGTWGHYTIVEGESDLFLKNNRSGKAYKFNLTEVK